MPTGEVRFPHRVLPGEMLADVRLPWRGRMRDTFVLVIYAHASGHDREDMLVSEWTDQLGTGTVVAVVEADDREMGLVLWSTGLLGWSRCELLARLSLRAP